jgi:hypothetical protein
MFLEAFGCSENCADGGRGWAFLWEPIGGCVVDDVETHLLAVNTASFNHSTDCRDL